MSSVLGGDDKGTKVKKEKKKELGAVNKIFSEPLQNVSHAYVPFTPFLISRRC